MIALAGIPVIETARLRLRAPEARDAEALVAFSMSERFRFIDTPKDRYDGWMHYAAILGHWVLRGFGLWSVTARAEDRCLGLVGCWEPATWPEGEIGWSLLEEAEGRGIAREAAIAAREHAFGPLGWPTAVSYIAPGNVRSIWLAERLGAVRDDAAALPEGETSETCLVYRHRRPEERR